jgi:hypothetical protein
MNPSNVESASSAANDVEIVPPASSTAASTDIPRLNEAAITNRQLTFPWAQYEGPHRKGPAKKGNSHRWGCTVCKAKGLVMKDRTDFQRHADTKAHKNASSTALQRSRMRSAQESMVIKNVSAELDMAGQLLIVAAFMIGNGLSLVLFPQVLFHHSSNLRVAVIVLHTSGFMGRLSVQMVMLMGCLGIRITDLKLNNHIYITRLVTALTEFFLQCTVRAVLESPFFGIVLDLSSDRSSREHMLVYVVYWDCKAMFQVTKYLCCVRLLRKDAEGILECLQKISTVLGLNMCERMVTFCADGDSTMQGHRKGLTGKLRAYCRHVLTMHCAAHKHVLAVQDVAAKSTLLELLDLILRSVYTLFNRKSKRVALWELFAQKHGVTAMSFPLFVKTRWFSRAACVRVLVRNYPVLVRFLQVLTRTGSAAYWAAAVPVLDLLTRADSVVLLHAMADVLSPLEASRKLFESTGCKLCDLRGEVTVLKANLSSLASAPSLQKFGSANMTAMMSASNNLAITNRRILLKWSQHPWSVSLKASYLPDDLNDQLTTICEALVDKVCCRRSPR